MRKVVHSITAGHLFVFFSLAILISLVAVSSFSSKTVDAATNWDKSSLSFDNSFGCRGNCQQVTARVCNTGSGDMQGPSTWSVYFSTSGNPKKGTLVGSGTINPLARGQCQVLTFDPGSLSGSYAFKAAQRPGHPGPRTLWSSTCTITCPLPTNTPTNTPTFTPTITNTNTPTFTPTITDTNTPTNTPTDTPVPSTPTPTNTPTDTPVPLTPTPTNTPTDTPVPLTPTPTNTPTDTPTPTSTPTPTDTPTSTPTPTDTPAPGA